MPMPCPPTPSRALFIIVNMALPYRPVRLQPASPSPLSYCITHVGDPLNPPVSVFQLTTFSVWHCPKAAVLHWAGISARGNRLMPFRAGGLTGRRARKQMGKTCRPKSLVTHMSYRTSWARNRIGAVAVVSSQPLLASATHVRRPRLRFGQVSSWPVPFAADQLGRLQFLDRVAGV